MKKEYIALELEKELLNKEILRDEDIYLKDILRYDYLTFNKKRGMPEFLRDSITKKEEEEIKEKYVKQYSFREYSIEKFAIDMEEYIRSGNIVAKDTYYLIGNSGNKVLVNY